jgi:flagellar hook protein FlgE
MTTALQAGVSGMLAHQTRMDAVGNNIANANTIGFKSSTAEFADLLNQTIRPATPTTASHGGTNPSAMGSGVTVSSVNTNYAQGTLQDTGRNLDVAIEGNGFLSVTDGSGIFMTRNGSLGIDSDGSLIQLATKLRVLATAPGSSTVTPASTVKIPVGAASLARATSNVTLGGNLDSRITAGQSQPITATVYDSLGAAHSLSLSLTKSATNNTWTVSGSSPDGAVSVNGSANLTFDATGAPQLSKLPLTLSLTGAGGAASSLNFDLNVGGMTQVAKEASASLASQDGLAPGTLTSVTIRENGEIAGVFSNGLTKSLGQLATATFANTDGLENVGNTLFRASVNSGEAAFNAPGNGSHGALRSGFLEGSNVDLTREFTDMIVTQRGYQANSRVITTSDQMLQELMQIIR